MKRGKRMLVMLAAIVILTGGYLSLQAINKKAEVKEETGTWPLTVNGTENVTGLRWEYNGTDYAFTKVGDTWQREDNADFPVDQTQLEKLAAVIPGVQATARVSASGDKADWGLAEPAFTLTVGYADGSTVKYSIGDATPFADGYYVSRSDEEGSVYTVGTRFSTSFNVTMTSLTRKEDIPAADTADRITVGNVLDAVRTDAGWLDNVTGEYLEDSSVNSMLSTLKNITWKELVLPVADEEALNTYGLGEAEAVSVILTAGEDTLRTLLIGGTDENGNYYARLKDSRTVYTVLASSLTTALNASAESLYRKKPFEPSWENMSVFMAETDMMRCEIVRKEEQTEAAAGDVTDQVSETVTLNGERDDAGKAKEIYQSFTGLTAMGRTDECARGEEVLRIHVTDGQGAEWVYTFVLYDADSYAVKIGGNVTLLFDAAEVDKLVRVMKAL